MTLNGGADACPESAGRVPDMDTPIEHSPAVSEAIRQVIDAVPHAGRRQDTAQLLTLMRIAVLPCHTVAPHQQVPSS